jgi:hypothetical protein
MVSVPNPDASLEEIFRFALSFNGYERNTHPDQCGVIANSSLERWMDGGEIPENLHDLRTCLFFEQRRWRHFGCEPDDETLRYLADLVKAIREVSGGYVGEEPSED